MKISMKKTAICSGLALSSLLVATPAFASTGGTPDPAVPGESVDIAPESKECAQIWTQLIDASASDPIYGALVVTWPDGTETVINPLTNPVTVTVPAGMTPGTATLQTYKGLVDGEPTGLYEACSGSFEIVEDATVPVLDPKSAALLGGVGVVAVVGTSTVRNKRRRTA